MRVLMAVFTGIGLTVCVVVMFGLVIRGYEAFRNWRRRRKQRAADDVVWNGLVRSVGVSASGYVREIPNTVYLVQIDDGDVRHTYTRTEDGISKKTTVFMINTRYDVRADVPVDQEGTYKAAGWRRVSESQAEPPAMTNKSRAISLED
jgi:hypothetical protein